MRPFGVLLLLLAMAASPARAEDAWPRAWTVNVAGAWKITGCPQAPDTVRELEVQQTGHRLTLAPGAGSAVKLNGSVQGHAVVFSVANADTLNCLPGATTLHFDGAADGARIVGTLHAADSGNHAATITIQLHREFMLSFDDGPVPGRTDRVLDALHHLRAEDGAPVRAAFFTVGAAQDFWDSRRYYAPYELWTHKGSTQAYPELVARILTEGHVLGNHTAHHAWFRWPRFADEKAVIEELRAWEATAPRDARNEKLFRPPYLITTAAVLAAARKNGYQVVLGETVGDAAPGANVDAIEWKIARLLETRDSPAPALLIFHDIRPVTSLHLREIVDGLTRQGYSLVHFDPQRLDGRTLIRPH